MTNLDFLKKHNYSIDGMTEESAKNFIIARSKDKIAFKYMKQRARMILIKETI